MSVDGQQEWQLQLPYDIVFTIIDTYLCKDATTLRSLSKTCSSLAQLCRPLRFRTVSISTNRRSAPTTMEKFAILLGEFPDIANLISDLRILDHGGMLQISRLITPEQESLCYILMRPFANLTHLEMSLRVVWTLMPAQVQHAFHVAFALPTLRDVVFNQVRIAVDLLGRFSHISSLEISGEVALPATPSISFGDSFCMPERLLFRDASRTGIVTTNLFHGSSPLRMFRLKELQVYSRGIHLGHLKAPLNLCSGTLTSLEIYVGTWGGQPTRLDLSPLKMLTSFTLSTDVSMMSYGGAGVEGPQRFSWLIATLESAPPRSRLESVDLIINTRSFTFTDRLEWASLDALFEPIVESKWPKLKVLNVRQVNRSIEDKNWYDGTRIRDIVCPMMPVLTSAGVLQFYASHEVKDFWNM